MAENSFVRDSENLRTRKWDLLLKFDMLELSRIKLYNLLACEDYEKTEHNPSISSEIIQTNRITSLYVYQVLSFLRNVECLRLLGFILSV